MFGTVNDHYVELTDADFVGTSGSRYARLNVPDEGGITRIVLSVNSGTFSFALFNSKKAFNADGSLAADADHYRVTPDLSSGGSSKYSNLAINPPYYYHNRDKGGDRAGASGGLYLHLTPSSWTGLTVKATVCVLGAV